MPTFIGRSFTAEKTISWFLFGSWDRWSFCIPRNRGQKAGEAVLNDREIYALLHGGDGYCGDIE